MGDTSKIVLCSRVSEMESLKRQGWALVDAGVWPSGESWWHLAPPEPTLEEQLRQRYEELMRDGNSEEYAGLYRQGADALERLTKIEGAAQALRPYFRFPDSGRSERRWFDEIKVYLRNLRDVLDANGR